MNYEPYAYYGPYSLKYCYNPKFIELINRYFDLKKNNTCAYKLKHFRKEIMNKYDQMIADGKYEEFENLVLEGTASLEDLSEEMFQKFKEWIEG